MFQARLLDPQGASVTMLLAEEDMLKIAKEKRKAVDDRIIWGI